MSEIIDFYFEYSSPYGYIAARRIEAIARRHDREVIWHPFLLGAVFKEAGTQPLTSYPLKGPYSKRDIERSARLYAIPFKWPVKFPVLTVNAARATLWAQRHAPHQAVPLIHALYDEIFRYGQDITRAESVGAIAEKTGINGQQVMEAIKTPELKDQLKTRNEEVLRQGIFGSPFMIVDEEPFWGADRLDMMDQWLRQGGW